MQYLIPAVLVLASALTSVPAQAGGPHTDPGETSLSTMLGHVKAGSWVEVTSGFNLNSLGTGAFTFTLVGEQTIHASTQSFLSGASTLFAGSAGANATANYSGAISSLTFNSNAHGVTQMASLATSGMSGTNGDIQVWKNGNSYVFAYEDWANGAKKNFDYNDMVVSVTAVPEPASTALMLAGLGMLGLVRRRRLGDA